MYREAPRYSVLRWLKGLGAVLGHCLALVGIAWAGGALRFDLPAQENSRLVIAAVWLVGALVLWCVVRPRWQARLFVVLGFALILVWWLRLTPRQDRDWKPNVAMLGSAEVEGDRLVLHNVRNFDYRTPSDFETRWEIRSFNLRNLRAMDLFLGHARSGWTAQPVFSFDFGDEGRVCFSMQTRQEMGESYSLPGSLYRRYEKIVVMADERDLVRALPNERATEQVWLYRLKLPPSEARTRLLELVAEVNRLHDTPAWYNAIAVNTRTSTLAQRPGAERLPWDPRLFFNAHLDSLLASAGVLDSNVPFDQLKEKSQITDRIRETDKESGFSTKLRTGLPGMD